MRNLILSRVWIGIAQIANLNVTDLGRTLVEWIGGQLDSHMTDRSVDIIREFPNEISRHLSEWKDHYPDHSASVVVPRDYAGIL
jgi:hypothetical protein